MNSISVIPQPLSAIHFDNKDCLPTPVKPKILDVYLKGYDTNLHKYLVSGFQEGFKLNNCNYTISDNDKTLSSARQLPKIVEVKINKELQSGRLLGPYSKSPYHNPVISPLGLREKKVPGEYRLIHHLSYPHGSSVNDGIPREYATVQYSTLSQAIDHIINFGPNCYLAKSDIKSAFRIIPIHPSDYHLLGMKWNGNYYLDRCLPMGASSSCLIFETFSTSLEWIVKKLTVNVAIIHVLDDFLFISNSRYDCQKGLDTFFTNM